MLGSRSRQSGGALIFVMVFIVIASLGYVMMARSSTNQRDTARAQNEETAVYQAALEALQKVKGDLLDSVSFFANVQQKNPSQLDALFFQYAKNSEATYATFLKNKDPITQRRLSDFFIDFARRSAPIKSNGAVLPVGYRSSEKSRTVTVDRITYEFSVRCLKDETFNPVAGDPNYALKATQYWRGDFDGCPISLDSKSDEVEGAPTIADKTLFVRDVWSSQTYIGLNGSTKCGTVKSPQNSNLTECRSRTTIYKNWSRLPKSVEVIVKAKKDDTVVSVREVAEIEPVVLNDFAFALGKIPRAGMPADFIPPEKQFNFFGGQIYGRIHFDDDGQGLPQVCPNWNYSSGSCNDTSTAEPYRIVINADSQSLIALRPVTTSGVKVDAFDKLENPDSNIQLHTKDTSIQFLGGWGSGAPPMKLNSQISNSIKAAETIPDAHVIEGEGCTFKPLTGKHKVKIECERNGPTDSEIDVTSSDSVSTFIFKNSVKVQSGAISDAIAVYSKQDIIFQGSVYFDLDTTGNASNKVFIPYQNSHPDPSIPNTVKNPLDIASADGTFQSFSESSSSLAMWVANNNIVIDAVNGRPLKRNSVIDNPTGSNTIGGGVVYEDSDSNPLYSQLPDYVKHSAQVKMVQENQSRSGTPLDYAFVVDGKSQVGGTIKILTQENAGGSPSYDLSNIGNMGVLAFRGGMVAAGDFPTLKSLDVANSCYPDRCVRGANYTYTPFDGRSQYQNFPGQAQIDGQSTWRTLTSEVSYSGKGFGNIALAKNSSGTGGAAAAGATAVSGSVGASTALSTGSSDGIEVGPK